MTLYRKYRPTTFSQITGQVNIKTILTEELKSGKLSHAYLFSGPRGTGKTSTARIFAKSLNCENRDKKTGEPCGKCQSCKLFTANRAYDLVEIDAASNRRIEDIRQLRENVKYVPSTSAYKVYVIDEVHMLTGESFNALLKTLEEPPVHVIFILATTELHKIPETIFSRCQHFAFTKLNMAQILERLRYILKQEKVEVEEEVLREISRKAGGAMRDAESLLGQILGLGKKKITAADASLFLPKVGFERVIAWLGHLSAKDGEQTLRMLTDLEAEGVNLEFFLQESLSTARQIMLFKVIGSPEYLQLNFSPDEIDRIKELSQDLGLPHLRKIIVELLRASQDMKLSPDLPILPIELAVVVICEDEGDNPNPKSPLVGTRHGAFLPEEQKTNIANQSDMSYVSDKSETKAPSVNISPPLQYSNQPSQLRANHSLEEILDGWGEVLTKVKDKNQALNFILGVAEPVAVRGDVVELGFKYRLQQEKVSEHANRQFVEEIIEEVYGVRYKLEPTVREDLLISPKDRIGQGKNVELQATDEEILIKTAMAIFEGAVMEN